VNCAKPLRKNCAILLQFSCVAIAIQPAVLRAEAAPQTTVDVTLVGNGLELAEFERLLAEWNSALVIHRATHLNAGDILGGGAGSGHLRIWAVLSPSRDAKLYFADPTGERFLVREVPLAAGLDESGREILAQVIATSAKAFVEEQASSTPTEVETSLNGEEGSSSEDAAKPPIRKINERGSHITLRGAVALGKTRVEPQSSRPWQAQWGLFYACKLVSSNELGHGPGVTVAAARSFDAWRWMAAALGQYRYPLAIESAAVTLALRSWTLGVTTGLERTVLANWALGGELGMLVERVEFSLPSIPSAIVVAQPAGVHYRPNAYVGMRASHDFGLLRVTALLGVEVALVRTHYDITNRPIFVPWIVEPRSAIELGWQ
jgi:hypothetical protein